MKDLKYIAGEISKGKNLDINLVFFLQYPRMYKAGNELLYSI